MSRGEGDPRDLSRRAALGFLGLGTLGLAAPAASRGSRKSSPPAPRGVDGRLAQAHQVRVEAADLARDRPLEAQSANGDEERLPGRVACFTKGLPHDAAGRVDPAAYDVLLQALTSGDPEDFERVPLGGYARLANPQAAWAFDLIGPDASQAVAPPAPRLDSAEQAAELVELYWQALAREVPFSRYGEDATTGRAADELSRLGGFTGPRREGRVTSDLLFRGSATGDAVGPYVSQFLWQPIPWTPSGSSRRSAPPWPAATT